jgi:mRNA-degrading endonuclease toxin of MazEF toxin-antitoxin module
VSTPARGRIIWVEAPDPQGRNPKVRPAVILTATQDIQPGGEVHCVAISSQVAQAPAEDQVALPWHPQGHPRTKLRERCAAVCTWLLRVSLPTVERFGGQVPTKEMLAILHKVGELPGAPPVALAPPEAPSGDSSPPT